MGRLAGKVALVTEASRGLGRAVAEAYAREGASLAICARGEEALQEAAAAIRELGVPILAVRAGVSDPHDIQQFVSLALQEYGKIDILVNNASAFGPSPRPLLIDYPAEEFAKVLQVNTLGPFQITQQVLSGMLQRGSGSVINVTSLVGSVAYPGWGAYSVSKFALEALSQIWAGEVEGTGVRVNLVDPGEMDTQMHALSMPDCDYPLARPEDQTEVFIYLASDDAKNVNGQRFEAQKFTADR